MVMILIKINTTLLPNRSARCFGICSMAEAVEEKKQRWTSGNLSMNTTWHLQKWILLLSKAKKPAAGGCNYPINVLSPVAIKIIYSPVVTRYLRDGFGHRKETDALSP